MIGFFEKKSPPAPEVAVTRTVERTGKSEAKCELISYRKCRRETKKYYVVGNTADGLFIEVRPKDNSDRAFSVYQLGLSFQDKDDIIELIDALSDVLGRLT